jgi:hypothetical protein
MSMYKYIASVKYNIKGSQPCAVLQQKGSTFCGQFETFHLRSIVVHLYNDSECNGWWKGIE